MVPMAVDTAELGKSGESAVSRVRIAAHGLASHRALGVAGSVVIVAGGLLAGVTPLGGLMIDMPVVTALRTSTVLSVSVVYVGVTMLLLAWWRIGVAVRAGSGPSCRELASTA